MRRGKLADGTFCLLLGKQQGKASRPAAREPGKANASERGERGKHGPDFRNEICGRRFEIVAARERISKKRIEAAAKIESFLVPRARTEFLRVECVIDCLGGKGSTRIGEDDATSRKTVHGLDRLAPARHERGPLLKTDAHV